ncbi:hypothetical protein [Dactylosporangium sp. CA-139066]|uniref:hypothetical protein n=1 Tax=Dactylosporangium sp. CA-139066 TaxID=3239930 RepID=UPI003D9364AB
MDVALRHLVLASLRRAGLWSWAEAVPIADRWGRIMVADVAFATARLAVDLGSSTFAPGGPARTRLRLAASGWTLTSYTRADFEHRATEITRELRALLDHLSPTRYP